MMLTGPTKNDVFLEKLPLISDFQVHNMDLKKRNTDQIFITK